MNKRLKTTKKYIAGHYYVLIAIILSFTACTKEFLDKKPAQSLLVPTTLSDFQALLDDANGKMNVTPSYNPLSDGDFQYSDAGLAIQTQQNINIYTWALDVYTATTIVDDWNRPYGQIFYANVVLDGLPNVQVNSNNLSTYNQIKGSALFYRAFALFNVLQEFASPYNASTAGQLPGVPIRTSSDVNLKVSRGTIQQSFDQVVNDLLAAEPLLPDQGSPKTRPGKAAAFAMLARVYLVMGNYQKAIDMSTSCLALNNKLLDYSTLSTTATQSFPLPLTAVNDEVLYYTRANTSYTSQSTVTVNPNLYSLYQSNDLRKVLYFKPTGNYKGSYTATTSQFSGLATDEIYLTRAEGYARTGDIPSALNDLNTLLAKRLKPFAPLTAATADIALQLVLSERRKELVARSLRWVDLRRLNQDTNFAVTLTRTNNGVTYTLPPNDKRYVFLIPQAEIDASGLEQNSRQ